MNTYQLVLTSISPLLVVIGVGWAVLRKVHKSAHHWQQVWNLPTVVDELSQGVKKLTQGAEHTADEIRQLRETVQGGFDQQRELPRGRDTRWQSGR